LSGNADANGTTVVYEVSTDGGLTWTTTTASQTNLADGDYRFHAVVTDPAGNSEITSALDVTADKIAPTAVTVSFAYLDDTGSDNAPPSSPTRRSSDLLSGNADANGTTVVYEVSTDGGLTWTTTTASQTNLADGDYRFHAVVTDPAGNS